MARGNRYEPERIKMLADAVFAIAMTILVLDLRLPEDLDTGDLPHALRHLVGQYAAYALSFYVLGMIWLGHVRLFRRIEAVDNWMFRANLFLLLFVGSLPFPTGVLGRFGSHTWGVVPYAACMVLLEAALALMWWRSARAELLVDDVAPGEVRSMIGRYAGMIVVFLLTIGVAFVAPRFATLTLLLLAVVPKAFEHAAGRRGAAPGPR